MSDCVSGSISDLLWLHCLIQTKYTDQSWTTFCRPVNAIKTDRFLSGSEICLLIQLLDDKGVKKEGGGGGDVDNEKC